MSRQRQIVRQGGFTVGICATGASPDVSRLVVSIIAEAALMPLPLRKLVVVASACPERILSDLRKIQGRDGRVDLVLEDAGRGKADAVNKILARADGDLVALVNSDATPESGAIAKLLAVAASDPSVGAVSAMPVTEPKEGLTALLVDFMWSAHNECSLALNHMNLSNHSSDELVVFRSSAIAMLPRNLVNDGAFLATTARRKGYAVRFCPSAKVHIETPGRVSDIIRQRRRILFGHAQVWRRVGHPPKTVESLLLFSTPIGLKLVVNAISRHPKFLVVLPVALLSEVSAALLAIQDAIRSSKRHTIWTRFT